MHDKDLERYKTLPYRFECYRDDDVWVVRYPELRGCIAHGSTIEGALAKGEEFKAEWLKAALEVGSSIPEPQPEPAHSGKLLVRLPRLLHQQIAEDAQNEAISINAYIVQAVAEKRQRTTIRYFANDLVMGIANSMLESIPTGALVWGDSSGKAVTASKIAQMRPTRNRSDNHGD
jgi:antitoxin HicB